MKILSLSKKSNGLYELQFEEKTLILDEDTILQFRLFENKEIDAKDLVQVEKFDYLKKLEKKAIDYAIRYGKSSKEVCLYLESKDIKREQAQIIVEQMIFNKWLDDENLASNLASSYARNSNGHLMIREKLKKHLFSSDIIEHALQCLSSEDIKIGIAKLYKKFTQKYKNLPEKEFKLKQREYFYRHGYTEIDTDNLK